MKHLLLLFVLLGLVLWHSIANASCSGSGTNYNCTSGSSPSEIQSAINNASNGAIITLASGNYSWNSWINFSNSKGASLICASEGTCNVAVSGTVLGMNGNCGGMNNYFYRISGFNFNGGSSYVIWFHAYNTGGCAMSNVRIDHNNFSGLSSDNTAIFFGDVNHPTDFFGVVDNNNLSNASSAVFSNMVASGNYILNLSGTRGTAKNMYFEKNTINISSMTNAGAGCMDSWGGASIVFRYNDVTNCLVASHGVTHSWGPINWEVYRNHFNVNAGAQSAFYDGYRLFHHQGSGELIVFDNIFSSYSGKNSDVIGLTHYRSAPPSVSVYQIAGQCNGSDPVDGNRPGQLGYPCYRQPGRDALGNLNPVYAFNNRWADTNALIPLTLEDPWGTSNPSIYDHIKADRDYYNQVSSFNGSTGMGSGLLANRPTTCATNTSENGGGVGYFATDVGAMGTLFRCSNVNEWTVQYSPYLYPHPLTSPSPTPTPTASPSPSPTVSPTPSASLSVSSISVQAGANITVVAQNPLPTSLDWIGLYAIGADDLAYLSWQYVGSSNVFSMPMIPNNYEFRLYQNNGYTLLAKSSVVTVQSAQDQQAPVVTISSPVNGSHVKKSSTITISANASDDVGITRVDFFVNGKLICTDTTSTYNCTWIVPKKPGASYNIEARGYDSSGNSGSNKISVIAQ